MTLYILSLFIIFPQFKVLEFWQSYNVPDVPKIGSWGDNQTRNT